MQPGMMLLLLRRPTAFTVYTIVIAYFGGVGKEINPQRPAESSAENRTKNNRIEKKCTHRQKIDAKLA